MTVVRSLVIETARREVTVGDTVTLRVRDNWNRPIENAVVKSRQREKRTDSDGRCQFTFRAPGYWKLTAVKAPGERVAYRPATGLIRAVPRAESSRVVQQVAPESR